MVRAYTILTFLSLLLACSINTHAQQFGVTKADICWSIAGQDSSITRVTWANVQGGIVNIVYVDQYGLEVDVSAGGVLTNGICFCCENVPPPGANQSPYVDTSSFNVPLVPIPPPIPPTYDTILYTYYAEIENITSSSQVEACIDFSTISEVCTNGGLVSVLPGYVDLTYTQLTPTRARVQANFGVEYVRASFYPVSFNVTATNPNGSITPYTNTFP